jgi:hypothetical protein
MGSTWDTATHDLPHENSPLLDIRHYNWLIAWNNVVYRVSFITHCWISATTTG